MENLRRARLLAGHSCRQRPEIEAGEDRSPGRRGGCLLACGEGGQACPTQSFWGLTGGLERDQGQVWLMHQSILTGGRE